MFRDSFDIKVTIKKEMLKSLVFGLNSRLPIGIMLSFYGYRYEVVPLMQELSHATRAYIYNEDGI